MFKRRNVSITANEEPEESSPVQESFVTSTAAKVERSHCSMYDCGVLFPVHSFFKGFASFLALHLVLQISSIRYIDCKQK